MPNTLKLLISLVWNTVQAKLVSKAVKAAPIISITNPDNQSVDIPTNKNVEVPSEKITPHTTKFKYVLLGVANVMVLLLIAIIILNPGTEDTITKVLEYFLNLLGTVYTLA